MKKLKTKNILLTVGIVILLAAIVYVRSRISPLIGNYSVEKNEKKVEGRRLQVLSGSAQVWFCETCWIWTWI